MSTENPANIVFFTFLTENLKITSMNDFTVRLFNLDKNEDLPYITDLLDIHLSKLAEISDQHQNNLIFKTEIHTGKHAGETIAITMNKPDKSLSYYATGIIENDFNKRCTDNIDYLSTLNMGGLYTNVFLNSHIGIAVIAPDRTVYKANPYIKNLFKIKNSNIEGNNFGDVFLCKNTADGTSRCGTTEACEYCSIRNGIIQVLETGDAIENSEISYEFVINDRLDKRWFTITISPIYHNGSRFAFVSFMDITSRKQIEKRLIRFGITDELTGLYNRRFIIKELHKLSEADESMEIPSSIVMIDIDDFKTVNDTYGHLAGDAVLKGLADVIENSTRHYDFSGRYGGEEFLIILPGTILENAKKVITRIAAKFRNIKFDGIAAPITFSAGIVEAMPGKHEHKQLFHKADEMMYAAKAAGKDCIRGVVLTEPDSN